MAKPTLYGVSGSRALRSIWAIEETGIEYEHVPTHFFKDSKTPEYLAINPNGRVPALVDGELTLFESMAINLYLARTYGGDLYPQHPADEARAMQWSVWAISEIEPLQMQIVVQKFFTPEERRELDVGRGAVQFPEVGLDGLHLSKIESQESVPGNTPEFFVRCLEQRHLLTGEVRGCQGSDRFDGLSIIGSRFEGRVEALATVGETPAIRPSIAGRAFITGTTSLMLDPDDPWPRGYRVGDTWPGLG